MTSPSFGAAASAAAAVCFYSHTSCVDCTCLLLTTACWCQLAAHSLRFPVPLSILPGHITSSAFHHAATACCCVLVSGVVWAAAAACLNICGAPTLHSRTSLPYQGCVWPVVDALLLGCAVLMVCAWALLRPGLEDDVLNDLWCLPTAHLTAQAGRHSCYCTYGTVFCEGSVCSAHVFLHVLLVMFCWLLLLLLFRITIPRAWFEATCSVCALCDFKDCASSRCRCRQERGGG